ncbi:MAG: rhomboid family intramembrane serine protease [Phycisphaeraceae bacterium]
MIFPIRTDRRLKRTPWVNYALIGANVFIFLLTYNQIAQYGAIPRGAAVPLETIFERLPAVAYFLWPADARAYQLISYQFLHGDWMHLAGNMLFLYVFGNSVEDRLGRVGYALFYLAGGAFAAAGHMLFVAGGGPVLGASGSVAAVTGAFLALFPLSNVTIVYWFLIIGVFQVSSIFLILFRIALDLVFHLMGAPGVAYMAHLAGYGAGFAIGMTLLLTRVLTREPYDLLSLIEQRRRRAQFQRLTRSGYQPWDHARASEPGKAIKVEITPEQQATMTQRSRISTALANHDNPEAARLYRDLLDRDGSQVLGQDQQLDLANQLMTEARYDHAAAAYELFLKHYPSYFERQQVQLILGLIYARYLDKPERARELLEAAVPRLVGHDQELAQEVLDEL